MLNLPTLLEQVKKMQDNHGRTHAVLNCPCDRCKFAKVLAKLREVVEALTASQSILAELTAKTNVSVTIAQRLYSNRQALTPMPEAK